MKNVPIQAAFYTVAGVQSNTSLYIAIAALAIAAVVALVIWLIMSNKKKKNK